MTEVAIYSDMHNPLYSKKEHNSKYTSNNVRILTH
jgi:hypothetical protein